MSTSPIVFWSSTHIPTLRCRRSRVDAGSSPSAVILRRLCRPPLRPPLGRRMTASGGWIDYPGHIWVAAWNEGAFYSPDGMIIQFDNGSVWQRVVEVPIVGGCG